MGTVSRSSTSTNSVIYIGVGWRRVEVYAWEEGEEMTIEQKVEELGSEFKKWVRDVYMVEWYVLSDEILWEAVSDFEALSGVGDGIFNY